MRAAGWVRRVYRSGRAYVSRASVCLCNDRKLERANDQRTASAEQPSEQSLREATQGGWETTTAAQQNAVQSHNGLTGRGRVAPQSALRTASIRTKRARKRDLHNAITRECPKPRITEKRARHHRDALDPGAQLASKETGPPGPAACLANFCRCPHRPSRA